MRRRDGLGRDTTEIIVVVVNGCDGLDRAIRGVESIIYCYSCSIERKPIARGEERVDTP